MNKKRHNQSGFSVVEALLIIIILSAVSLAGWFVMQIQHATDGQDTSSVIR